LIDGYADPIHCHKRSGHGTVTFERGLQQSCNPVLMTLGLRLGQANFYRYFEAFGYTERTGIDLPGEARSMYSTLKNFDNVSLAVYSFGQTFKVTPIQQLTAIASVANGGYLLTPYLVDQIIDDDGNILMQHESNAKRQVISASVCETIAGILQRGVSGDGGAKNAYVPGYKIAAKTGTSEVRDKADENGEFSYRVGSCVAYAPADDPQIAAIIVVDTPMCQNKYGSVVAAPYIANLMDELLPEIGIERLYTEEELAKIKAPIKHNTVSWPTAEAVRVFKNLNFNYELRGDGNVITYQIPAKGQQILKNEGKVILYCGDATPVADIKVPDVVGRTASAANRILTNEGFNVIIDGATNSTSTEAYVVSQSLTPGTLVTEASVITITVRYLDGTAN
jgi:stage V sporulation protein D (sporulation-specific penicillin-binding protein)